MRETRKRSRKSFSNMVGFGFVTSHPVKLLSRMARTSVDVFFFFFSGFVKSVKLFGVKTRVFLTFSTAEKYVFPFEKKEEKKSRNFWRFIALERQRKKRPEEEENH